MRILSWALVAFILLSFNKGEAKNLSIQNIQTSVNKKDASKTDITFDVAWEFSWKTTQSPSNWDAAWIFIKIQSGKEWLHADIEKSIPASGAEADISKDKKGMFLFRKAEGKGNVSFGKNTITINKANLTAQQVKVLGVEMVFVPSGAFYIGDGKSAYTFGDANNAPVLISNKGTQVKTTKSFLDSGDKILENGIYVDGVKGINTQGSGTSINNGNFPTGFKGFYCMKYELTLEQYEAFLSLLTPAQLQTRKDVRDHTINFRSYLKKRFPKQPCGELNWMDGCAYADWAALRPMTELEFEKASRGTQKPVAGEFAWGTTTIADSVYEQNNSGTPEESIINTSKTKGNAAYGGPRTTSGTTPYGGKINGWLKAGIFELQTFAPENRVFSGASFYGIFELSGNLYEQCVSLGNDKGRAFTGEHGDGSISSTGNANTANWPGNTNGEITGAQGSGFRGGCYTYDADYCRISDRDYASFTYTSRNHNRGFRCVRSVEK